MFQDMDEILHDQDTQHISGYIWNEKWRRFLFINALEGNWEKVVDICNRFPWLCRERITRGGNTALHVAVSDRQERVVKQLVGVIESQFAAPEAVRVLQIQNKKGNTPLHSAVLLGNVAICKCISDGRPDLVGVRNEHGETPLFLAACLGKMDTFFSLLRSDTRHYAFMRNKKGDTILHCAIREEHWRLAFRIIKMHEGLQNILNEEGLQNILNEEGLTPLHVLANKPDAFRSGTYLSLFDKLIYHFVPVPRITVDDDEDKASPKTLDKSNTNLNEQQTDEAETNFHRSDEPGGPSRQMIEMLEKGLPIIHNEGAIVGQDGDEVPFGFPRNYDTCFTFIKLLKRAVGHMTRTWLNNIRRIKKKKETNLLSVKIMERLLELQKSLEYDYDKSGWNPHYAETMKPYADSEKENKPEQDWPSGLPDFGFELETGTSENSFTIDTSNSRKNDKGTKISEEGSNWALLFKLDKDGPRADVVVVRGGDHGDAIAKARAAATNLDDELRKEAQKRDEMGRGQTPILLAAKNGITEMVERILETNPIAIHDVDMERKNAVLLAVENRQPQVCEFLLKRYSMKSIVLRAVDKDGCSALHLAAKFSDNRRSFIPGAALQMQCEVLWYEYVKRSIKQKFVPSHNNFNQTADEIFTDNHEELMEKGKEWLKDTSNSCSLVATIIATVAFATSTSVPGGTRDESGKPYLEHQLAFHIFAISSLVALCFSVTSTIMFLAILTSRHQERDFGRDLPRKLLLGMTTLFISILAMLVNFCSGHFFVLQDELRLAAVPVYAITCLPATYFAVAQLPLYIDLLWATFSRVPRHWMKKDV